MITIAIDGPSAAGKSATAKALSDKLGILHLNTGALYRAIGYYVYENNLDINDVKLVESHMPNIDITVSFENNVQKTILNGKDISEELYTSIMGNYASISSSYGFVREKMLHLQRDIASKQSVIVEGRDITSYVLPNANFKFFLTASAEERSKRRLQNLLDLGESITYEEVLADIKERDHRDTSRSNNPLVLVDDAVLVKTDEKDLDEVVEFIVSIINDNGNN